MRNPNPTIKLSIPLNLYEEYKIPVFFQEISDVARDPTSHNRAYITLAKVKSSYFASWESRAIR